MSLQDASCSWTALRFPYVSSAVHVRAGRGGGTLTIRSGPARAQQSAQVSEEQQAENRRRRQKAKLRAQLERKYELMERKRQLKLLAGEELPPELQEIPTIPEELLETDDEGQSRAPVCRCVECAVGALSRLVWCLTASCRVLCATADDGPDEVITILRCRVHGTIGAVTDALAQYPQEEVAMKVVKSGVGDVTESDVELAAGLNALILGFDVKVPAAVRALAERTSRAVHVSSGLPVWATCSSGP